MANTYTQCYFHIVFSVKNRGALIRREWKDEYVFEFFDDIHGWD